MAKKTNSNWRENPWARESSISPTGYTVCCDAESRITQILQSNDVAWLRRVMAWTDSQVSVRAAAERRFKRLQKGN